MRVGLRETAKTRTAFCLETRAAHKWDKPNMNQRSSQPDHVLRSAIVVIALILGFSALYQGAEVFAPLVMGCILGIILGPIMDALEKTGLPRSLAALFILLGGAFGAAGLIFIAEPLIWRIVEELPRIKWEIRSFVEDFRGVVRGLDEVNKQMGEALGTDTNTTAEEAAPAMPSLTDALFVAPRVIAQLLIFLGTLFFFLLTRHNIYAWIAKELGGPEGQSGIKNRFQNAEHLVSRYFLTISAINAALGVALAVVLTVIGLPGAVPWGVAAALLNFILYLGPGIIVFGLAIAGLAAFQGLYSFLPAVAFLSLNLLEAQFVTPTLLGRNVSLNPLLIFVSLVFWMWLWGPIGGIIAIPVLLVVTSVFNIVRAPEASGPE